MFIIYDDSAKHHSKYYKTLKGVENALKQEFETASNVPNLIGDNWSKTPVGVTHSMKVLKKEGSLTLEMQKKSGYNLVLRVKKLRFADQKDA